MPLLTAMTRFYGLPTGITTEPMLEPEASSGIIMQKITISMAPKRKPAVLPNYMNGTDGNTTFPLTLDPLCMRARIPSMEAQCAGKCRETACVRSCEEACTRKGFPKLPAEGIRTCELEPLTPDEVHMLH
ncbi:hypothetical protein E2562_011565 [Oryza meyeriana var. granulata]|uniref:Uncharacterized protein n=1 Tax=Oryza meyeriana var. granulata TaxID=110450 RepID=A0A6G1DVR7_9ORYZ|nr:hypothetical protein E2562_011565 [Oryza meyeriana var. granulata]